MQYATLRCIATNHTIQCSNPTTGATLLSALKQEHLTLACVKPLNNGAAFRRYRYVRRDGTLYDLTQYAELYNAQHALFALIVLT